MRKIVFFIGLISFLHAQTYIIPDLQRDDFKNLKTWWSVNVSGTNHTWAVNNGYFIGNLINPLDGGEGGQFLEDEYGMENIGFSTAYLMHVYDKNDTIEMIIRVRTLNDLPPGSRGWGLWRSESVPITINQATWFIEQTADSVYPWASTESWWRARITRGLQYEKRAELTFSDQQWHTYRVVRFAKQYYELYVDDDPTPVVYADTTDLGGILNEDYGFDCWNDNLVYYHTTNANSGNDTVEVYYNGWIGTSSYVVDYVEIKKGLYKYGHSVAPQGAVRLREVINEIDNGVQNGLWKGPYEFTVGGGPCLILATGKAEELDGYDDDDDLKIVLDSTDFGFDSPRSWNGDVDQGQPKTIIIDTVLAPGTHQLSFYSEVTPILYDATVLESPNGEVVVNQTLNESAPVGSVDYLWKTFNFDCDSGQIAIYISGNADEEPGWNYRNYPDPYGVLPDIDSTDDDELRIMLDDIDYGWGTDSAFMGNTLFGDSKTILIMQNVQAGNHTLKLYANETPTVYNVIVYAENKPTASSVEQKTSIIKDYSLGANYPNPFNPSTVIPFAIPEQATVRLEIFDIMGRSVKELVNKKYAAGKYSVVWDGKDARGRPTASGLYFCRLKANNRLLVRKIIKMQ
ncbi:MAG: T9SS type A sorting domain-containing protein [Calditrichaeota bacterium]|nr:T9SS type A sorting domain-containing protein [Calditrichota bacterium]